MSNLLDYYKLCKEVAELGDLDLDSFVPVTWEDFDLDKHTEVLLKRCIALLSRRKEIIDGITK
jgi:hypothetical protein